MKQYLLEERRLILINKKASWGITGVFAFFSSMAFLASILVFIDIASGNSTAAPSFLAGIFLLWFVGFYFARVFLWNTWGREIIDFSAQEIAYVADYKWFTFSAKKIKIDGEVVFFAESVGYEDEKMGNLIIQSGKHTITCSAKIPIDQVILIAKKLNNAIADS